MESGGASGLHRGARAVTIEPETGRVEGLDEIRLVDARAFSIARA
jgi:hypothetical protein